MTSNDIVLPSPPRVGQATAVEQTRSVAEVHAQITAARQLPRDVQAARRAMVDACAIGEFAARAFFRYPRSGSTVTGPSVHLARELARCWGNLDYGIKELARDDEHGQSEMLAFAWDMESNVRSSNVFIVPHKRDKKGKDGPVPLVDMRDIYENNANNGARRVRQAIFAVLPPWFTEAAIAACHETNRTGGGEPLPDRIAKMLAAFTTIGVSEQDIERRLGRPNAKWTGDDVATLGVIFTSIQRGEVSRDEEFPPSTLTTEEITAARPAEPATAPEPAQSVTDLAPAELVAKVKRQLDDLGVTEPAEQLHVLGQIAGRTVPKSANLTVAEAQRAAELFNRAAHADEPSRALDALLAAAEPDGS